MNRFSKRDRIVRGDDFTAIIRGGTFAADDVLVVNVQGNGGSESTRLGITIPQKTGSAVVRNRWKRWIREAFRVSRDRLPAGIDIVVRPKRDAVGNFATVAKSLPNTVRRAARKLNVRGDSA